jgi:hypothetical protein
MRKKRKKFGFDRINALLDTISGKPNDALDRRKSIRFPKGLEKKYSVKRDRSLFKSLVLSDFNYLLSLKFVCEREVLQVLLPQSVVGRAMTGQGWFTDTDGYPIVFEDVTFDNILTVIEEQYHNLNNIFVRTLRTELINHVFSHVLDNIDTDTMSLERNGKPLLGIKLLEKRKVKTRAFLQGMVIAGFMDDYELRQNTVEHYKTDFMGDIFDIGGGEQFVVDRKNFKLLGIKEPGKAEFSNEDIEKLIKSGTVFNDVSGNYTYPEHDKVFFRFKDDFGISDDLALISIGAIYGFDAMLGALVMDAIDTYEKYLIEFKPYGEDKNFAKKLQKNFEKTEGKPLVSKEEIMRIIYIAAKNNFPKTYLSSSHRRFIQVEKGATVPTILNHWNFVSGEAPVYDILLGYSQVPAKKFYSTAYLRLKHAGINIQQSIFY